MYLAILPVTQSKKSSSSLILHHDKNA